MTHPTLENAITEEFARQAATTLDGAGVRDRVRTRTVDAACGPHARRPWLLPSLASVTVAAIAITVTILASKPAHTPTPHTSAPPAASAGTACSAQSLSISLSPGTANFAGAALARFTNTASTGCTLSGYPAVTATTTTTTRKVAQQTLAGPLGGVRDQSTPPQMTLQPGDTATSLIESNDGDGVATDCKTFDHLAVAFSPTSSATVVTVAMAVCNLQVHPFVAGLSGTSESFSTVDRPQPAQLLVHCGVKYASFDGRTWKITSPVPAWHRVPINGITTENGYIQGTMTLANRDTLIFTIHDQGVAPDGQQFTFHPTQDHLPLCA